MHEATLDSQLGQGALSLIEVLGSRLEANKARREDHTNEISDEEDVLFSNQEVAICELLSLCNPETPRDIPILERALSFWLEVLACGAAEHDDEEGRQDTFEKAFRIKVAIADFQKSRPAPDCPKQSCEREKIAA
jgi:hypothetical protein